MNVNQKGNMGLLKVMEDLYNKGYHCFVPFDDYSPVDLIVLDKTGNVKRLQVKYRTLNKKHKRYELSARSVINGKVVPIDRNLIDGWAVYLANDEKIVYLTLEIMEGKNNHYIKQGIYECYKTCL
jgi:hypothetical protein